jgi:hypothetical protein
MSSHTCPLCGLRYAGRPLLELHIREDHAQRDNKPAAPAPDPAPAPPPIPAPASPPRSESTSWAETARRALNRMIGRESADPARRA